MNYEINNMPNYLICAYQEMFTQVQIEAENEQEARSLFFHMVEASNVDWRVGDEECEIADVLTTDSAETVSYK